MTTAKHRERASYIVRIVVGEYPPLFQDSLVDLIAEMAARSMTLNSQFALSPRTPTNE